FELGAFVEKPDKARAESYLKAGDYSWNSGIFLFPAALYLAELQRLAPDTVAACRKAFGAAKRDIDFLRLDKDAFGKCENKSIDYAVMEHTSHAAMIPVSMGWSDAGTWDALWHLSLQDENQDVRVGDVVAEDTKRSYLRAEHVSALVKRLEREGRPEASANPIVHRPWGSFRSIHNGERVQVKHITVKPGAKLSLQMHHHRAEHWVVVSGTAKVVRGNEEIILHEDQSTYIPLGTPHRLENPGKIPLHVIEVQSGSYLGEDDIVRFEDSYGRS